MTEYDTTDKVEEVETGFKISVKSVRGTGTRDSDTVKAELRTEEHPTADEIDVLLEDVRHCMAQRRGHHPDAEDGEE